MDDLHKEMELRVTSPHLSEQYERRFHFTSAGAGVQQGADTGVRGLALDSPPHVLHDKLQGAFQVSEQRLCLVLECEVLVR
ncbi:hypothetical protein RND71_042107 [Anisodus tanguticus]|uniref:Uncharacterized protein n=1 Tax=Anisodus tanguticus TaxID=243964 RepID=A0AAE1QQB7_9SOLA|nr:hypothetical protein RND71_042107 [Anisodus tanguticus]